MASTISQEILCQEPKNNIFKKRTGFDPIDRNFWSDPNLNGSSIKVLGYLSSNDKDFNPSMRAIAKVVCLTVKTVSRALRRLQQFGYISALKRRGMLTIYNILKSPVKKLLSTGVVQKTVLPMTPHRNSNTKDKQSNLSDVVLDKYELVKKKLGLKSSIKSLGFKLAKSFHGSKGYDFKKANTFYSDLIVKYGKKGYEELKKYANSSHKVTKWTREWQRYILDNIEAQIDGKTAF